MSLGLLTALGPLQMLFSLLLMQGLSLTMFRTFLNQAIPRMDPMKFSLSLGNNQFDQNKGTVQFPSSPTPLQNIPEQNLMQLLMPIMLQNMQRQQQMPIMSSGMQPMASFTQPQAMTSQVAVPAQVLQVPQMNHGHPQMPQVIIVPQLVPQQTDKGSASTHIPVQVEAPKRDLLIVPNYSLPPHITKRMLERPPKTTTRRPKVVNRAHAGTMYVQFATPRAPAGFRRYIIPPVTANIGTDMELSLTTESYDMTSKEVFVNGYHGNTHSYSYVKEDLFKDTSVGQSAKPETSTQSMNDNLIESNDIFSAIRSTSTINTSSVDTTNVTSDQMTSDVVMNGFNGSAIIDTKTLNVTKDESMKINSTESTESLSDLIHEDFVHHVKNLSDNHFGGNQVYFDNSEGQESHQYRRVCYYLLRARNGNLDISSIDPFICSHIIIGFASVSANSLLVPRNPSEDPEKYRELTSLKSINRKLKVMLSVGDGSGLAFSKMVSTDRNRDNFVASVLDFCDAFDFDGVDIDWEYPYFRTGSKDDKKNFVLLLKELRAEAIRRFRENFIISATVGTPLVIAMSSYDIPLIGEAVDFVNLMSYDFNIYRSDRPYTGHHSPLYPRPTEKQYFQTLNAAWSATYWANNGMPLNKIVLGIPTYARTYSLVVPISQGMDVPVSGPGLGGGKLNYTAVCHFLSSGATREFDIYSQVPFAYKDFDWVAYESEISVALKAQWVVKARMGGIMTFALNYDDVKGDCRKDGKKFPLQKAISNLLELSSMKTYRNNNHSPDFSHFISKEKF